MNFKKLSSFDLEGKTIILRADLNVPVKEGKVTNTARIDRLKKTIDYLASHSAKTLIISHFGRPKGEADPALSLAFLPEVLKAQWGVDVAFSKDCIGESAQNLSKSLAPGQFGLLENLRFHKGEKENNSEFAQKLAKSGDIYINDAFSVSHRAHASIEALPHMLPAGAGFLMEEELTSLHRFLDHPKRPFAAIVGGAKISTKLGLLSSLTEKVNMLILGGGMANTFLYAQGHDIKSSLCEKDMKEEAQNIIEKAISANCKLILPIDATVATELKQGAQSHHCNIENVPENHMIFDIGPKTLEQQKKALEDVKTVAWNGPMGIFEMPPFDTGTVELAKYIAKRSKENTIDSISGGGDTVAALELAGANKDFSYISTAGGAFLTWLEGKTLPGVTALASSHKKFSNLERYG